MAFFAIVEQVSPTDLQKLMSKMKVPPCPEAPVVGKVTHYSVDLSWDESLAQANDVINKGDGRIQVTLQEQKAGGAWGKAYSGFAAKHTVESLEPWSQYSYRIKFTNLRGESDWSAPVSITTAKEPFTGDHLHRAIFLDDKTQLERILDSGDVSVDTPDKHGYSPLMAVAQKGNLDMIDILMSNGADVDYQNDVGKTPLMVAALAGQVAAVKELRHHGASYDKRDKGGSTAVHWAVDGGNLELVDWMLDDGADIGIKDDNGWTPLMRVAAVGGNKDMANLLLRHHAEANARDKDGKTALMMAVVNGHQPLVQLLLDKNADVTIKNEFGKTAYDMALSMERRKVIQSLEEHMQRRGLKIHN